MEQVVELVDATRQRLERFFSFPLYYEGVSRVCLPNIEHSYVTASKKILWTVRLPPASLLGEVHRLGSAFTLDKWQRFTQGDPSFDRLTFVPVSVEKKILYEIAEQTYPDHGAILHKLSYDGKEKYSAGEEFPFPVMFTFFQNSDPVKPALALQPVEDTKQDLAPAVGETSSTSLSKPENENEIEKSSLGASFLNGGLKILGTATALLTGHMWIPNFIDTQGLRPLDTKATYKRKRDPRATTAARKEAQARKRKAKARMDESGGGGDEDDECDCEEQSQSSSFSSYDEEYHDFDDDPQSYQSPSKLRKL